jgi:serine-type D-Ala-D-Ala carboxypeptidase
VSPRGRRGALLLSLLVLLAHGCRGSDPAALLAARLQGMSPADQALLLVGAPQLPDTAATILTVLHAPPALTPEESDAERTVRELSRAGQLVGVIPFAHRSGVRLLDLARLQAVEEPWIERLRAAGAAVLVLPSISLPALTADTLPLGRSAAAASWARHEAGWEGPIAALVGGPDEAVTAIGAGFDLALVPDAGAAAAALASAAEAGRLPRARLEEAALRRLALGREASPPAPLRVRILEPPRAEERAARERAPVLRQVPPAAVGMSEALLRQADSVLLAAVREEVIPGATLVIARRGGVVRARGYGLLAPGDTLRGADPRETLYDLASLTKVLGTTLAAMLLLEEGRISLDDPLRRFLPEFGGPGRDGVTLRHLLLHNSGLPAGLNVHRSADSPDDALQRIARVRLLAAPGEVVLYSDLGMILLAAALERAAGEALDRFLARRVFAPLGLEATMYLPPLALRPFTAPASDAAVHEFPLHGIVHDGNAFRLGGLAGHAGLFSTALETAVLSQLVLGGGCYGGVCLLTRGTVESFTRAQAETRALGWDTPAERSSAGSFFSQRSFGHTGYTGTSVWMDPERELLVVLLTNRTLTETPATRLLRLRQEVHNAAARAVADVPATRRPGAEPPPQPPRRRR